MSLKRLLRKEHQIKFDYCISLNAIAWWPLIQQLIACSSCLLCSTVLTRESVTNLSIFYVRCSSISIGFLWVQKLKLECKWFFPLYLMPTQTENLCWLPTFPYTQKSSLFSNPRSVVGLRLDNYFSCVWTFICKRCAGLGSWDGGVSQLKFPAQQKVPKIWTVERGSL